jgi:hypothetical protein
MIKDCFHKPSTVQPGGGGSALSDWTLADVTSSSWTKNDPDTTMSGLSHVNGVNKCTISTQGNNKVHDGCVWYKEIKTEDGSSFNFNDNPVSMEFAITMPSIGWSIDSGNQSGGLNRPPVASKVYCLAGVMTDPENLPSQPGTDQWPADFMGQGIDTSTSIHKNKRLAVYNASSVQPRGAITTPTQWLPQIGLNENRKSFNRMHWWARIRKHDGLSGQGCNNVGDPICKDMHWIHRDDIGNSKTGVLTQTIQQRFRVRNNKLYVWISVGRSANANSPADLDFTVHYRITQLDGGTCPSGRTGL